MSDQSNIVEVVPIKLEKHPAADTLSIVKVFHGYTVLVRTTDWKGINIGAYIPPDSVVPKTQEYAFLSKTGRLEDIRDKDRVIRAKKLRGIVSMGLLMPAPAGSKVGDDVTELMNIKHYEPEEPKKSHAGESSIKHGQQDRPPLHPLANHKYDVESWHKYGYIFHGQSVLASEKLHGSCLRATFSFKKGQKPYIKIWKWKIKNPLARRSIQVGSRQTWKKKSDIDNTWQQALQDNPWLEKVCKAHPDAMIFGEAFGPTQFLKYGYMINDHELDKMVPGPNYGKVQVRIFDIWDKRWLDFNEMIKYIELAIGHSITISIGYDNGYIPPILYYGEYDEEKIKPLANGPSLIRWADNIREGIVIKTVNEVIHPRIGRSMLKIVGSEYLQM